MVFSAIPRSHVLGIDMVTGSGQMSLGGNVALLDAARTMLTNLTFRSPRSMPQSGQVGMGSPDFNHSCGTGRARELLQKIALPH